MTREPPVTERERLNHRECRYCGKRIDYMGGATPPKCPYCNNHGIEPRRKPA